MRRLLQECFAPKTVAVNGDAQTALLPLGPSFTDRANDDDRFEGVRAALLDLVTDCAKLGLWVMDLDPNHPDQMPDRCHISDAMKRLAGFGPSELPSTPYAWLELVLPDDRHKVRGAMSDHLSGRSSDHDVEYRVHHRNGSIRWLRSCGRVLHDGEGRPRRWIGVEMDITEWRHREEEVSRTQQKFASLFRLMPSPASLATVADGRFVEVNDALTRSLKYSREELLGRTALELGIWPSPEARDRFAATLAKSGSVQDLRVTLVDADGEHRDVDLAAELLELEGDTYVLSAGRDVTAELAAERRLKEQAHRDPLTGVANRILGETRLEESLACGSRDQSPTAVLFVDLDGLKTVNDTLGHCAGDELLIAVSRRLTAGLRHCDTLARFGGDEFVVVARGLDETAAVTLARRLLAGLAAPLEIGGVRVHPTASVGVAVTHGRDDAAALLRRADDAMYRVKRRSGNAVHLDAAEDADSPDEQETARELRSALDCERFELLYQPLIRLGDLRVWGAEALLRWHHPRRGVVPPAEFIPLAEQSGLIVAIGDWVLRRACLQLADWRREGTVNDDFVLSVNVAATQLDAPDFASRLSAVLEETGVPPSCLMVELTERVALAALDQVEQLTELGVRLAIDDFGFGYGTMSYLRRLHVDVLKVDQVLIRDLVTDRLDASLVRSVLFLARDLDREVIVEGVETAEQLRVLREMGCELGQGYLFAEPLTADQLAAATTRPRRAAAAESPRALPFRSPAPTLVSGAQLPQGGT